MINFPTLFRDFDRSNEALTAWRPLFRHLDDLLGQVEGQEARGPSFAPPVDVTEDEGHYLISFDVPGMKKDDLAIEVDGRTLTVSGERKFEQKADKGKTHFVERRYGSFQRTFTLPEGVKADAVEADYRDGVLTVAIPKAPEAKATKVKIGDGKSGLLKGLLTKDESQKTSPH